MNMPVDFRMLQDAITRNPEQFTPEQIALYNSILSTPAQPPQQEQQPQAQPEPAPQQSNLTSAKAVPGRPGYYIMDEVASVAPRQTEAEPEQQQAPAPTEQPKQSPVQEAVAPPQPVAQPSFTSAPATPYKQPVAASMRTPQPVAQPSTVMPPIGLAPQQPPTPTLPQQVQRAEAMQWARQQPALPATAQELQQFVQAYKQPPAKAKVAQPGSRNILPPGVTASGITSTPAAGGKSQTTTASGTGTTTTTASGTITASGTDGITAQQTYDRDYKNRIAAPGSTTEISIEGKAIAKPQSAMTMDYEYLAAPKQRQRAANYIIDEDTVTYTSKYNGEDVPYFFNGQTFKVYSPPNQRWVDATEDEAKQFFQDAAYSPAKVSMDNPQSSTYGTAYFGNGVHEPIEIDTTAGKQPVYVAVDAVGNVRVVDRGGHPYTLSDQRTPVSLGDDMLQLKKPGQEAVPLPQLQEVLPSIYEHGQNMLKYGGGIGFDEQGLPKILPLTESMKRTVEFMDPNYIDKLANSRREQYKRFGNNVIDDQYVANLQAVFDVARRVAPMTADEIAKLSAGGPQFAQSQFSFAAKNIGSTMQQNESQSGTGYVIPDFVLTNQAANRISAQISSIRERENIVVAQLQQMQGVPSPSQVSNWLVQETKDFIDNIASQRNQGRVSDPAGVLRSYEDGKVRWVGNPIELWKALKQAQDTGNKDEQRRLYTMMAQAAAYKNGYGRIAAVRFEDMPNPVVQSEQPLSVQRAAAESSQASVSKGPSASGTKAPVKPYSLSSGQHTGITSLQQGLTVIGAPGSGSTMASVNDDTLANIAGARDRGLTGASDNDTIKPMENLSNVMRADPDRAKQALGESLYGYYHERAEDMVLKAQFGTLTDNEYRVNRAFFKDMFGNTSAKSDYNYSSLIAKDTAKEFVDYVNSLSVGQRANLSQLDNNNGPRMQRELGKELVDKSRVGKQLYDGMSSFGTDTPAPQDMTAYTLMGGASFPTSRQFNNMKSALLGKLGLSDFNLQFVIMPAINGMTAKTARARINEYLTASKSVINR